MWRAGALANQGGGWVWPWAWRRLEGWPSDIEHWTSRNLGWSLPCAEAVGLIRRYVDWPRGRTIDVGAGTGLWTKVLKREFGTEAALGLDPDPKNEWVIKTTFEDWCKETGGLRDGDVVVVSWLPCRGQPGAALGTQVLDRVLPQHSLVYIGSGPHGPAGTQGFYDRLAKDFEEQATEPLPRLRQSIFPRDFARVYRRKGVMLDQVGRRGIKESHLEVR